MRKTFCNFLLSRVRRIHSSTNQTCLSRSLSVINRNANRTQRMPSVGSNQMLNSIQTKQVNKVKPNVNRPPIPDGVVVSPSSYNRYAQLCSFSPEIYFLPSKYLGGTVGSAARDISKHKTVEECDHTSMLTRTKLCSVAFTYLHLEATYEHVSYHLNFTNLNCQLHVVCEQLNQYFFSSLFFCSL